MAKMKQRLSVDGSILTIEYPTIGKKFVVDTSQYDEGIQESARLHGYMQKFGDAASGGDATEKYEEVQAIHASLLDGEWKRTASPDTSAIVIEALERLKGIPKEKLQEAFEKAPERLKEFRTNRKVKAEIAKIHAERAALRAEDAEDLEIDL